jgi:AraC-like DNA-binding protein
MLVLTMARPSKEPPCSSSIVPSIVRYAAARGVDVEALTWRFGLPLDVSQRDEVTAAADVPNELLNAVALMASMPDVALRVASELGSRRQKLVELAVRASANVRDALARLARWVPLLHEGFEAYLQEGAAGELHWVLRTPRRPRGLGRYVHELALAYAIEQVRAGVQTLSPLRVWFNHARPSEIVGLREYFRTHGIDGIVFGSDESGLAFAPGDISRSMRLSDPCTVDTIAPLVEAEIASRPKGTSFAERLTDHIARSLPHECDMGEVACAMHMSPRTLQRRLEQEETQFTEVLDRARLRVASRLLAEPEVTVTDVAFRLGFADLATFSRAFKRWTGKPPGQWRRS